MLDASVEAVELMAGKTRQDLAQGRLLQLGIVRLLEVVGEAAARVSGSTRQRCARIPWPEIIGMRNHLIHGYDSIDYEVLWKTVREDLPALIPWLEEALHRDPD